MGVLQTTVKSKQLHVQPICIFQIKKNSERFVHISVGWVPFSKFLGYGFLEKLKMAFGIKFENNTYIIHRAL